MIESGLLGIPARFTHFSKLSWISSHRPCNKTSSNELTCLRRLHQTAIV